MSRVRGWLRVIAGVALGAATALVDLGFLLAALVASPVLARWPQPRAALWSGAQRLAELERRRVDWLLGPCPGGQLTGRRAAGYLAARVPLGLLGGLVLLLLVYGSVTGVVVVGSWFSDRPLDGIEPSPLIVSYLVVGGAVLLFLDLQGIAGVAALDRRLAAALLGPSPQERYERRIAELSTARAEVVAAVDAERRRIERDLHDGVQQRLVALGMLIGRARRASDPARASALLAQAHEESARALTDLREVSWRVYPAALDEHGLAAALETVAERSPVPVRIEHTLPLRLPSAVETVAYFVVCEAVTNAAKHARATGVDVRIAAQGRDVLVRISDDGVGGADLGGGGLSGLARRVTALDGRFQVDSPAGGPTVISAELPCG